MIMSFGKYEGQPLTDVPTGYLQNILKTTKNIKLMRLYSDELKRRNEPLRFIKKGKVRKKLKKPLKRKVKNSFVFDFSLPASEEITADLTHLYQKCLRRARKHRFIG